MFTGLGEQSSRKLAHLLTSAHSHPTTNMSQPKTSDALLEAQKRTLARLSKIQEQFNTIKGSGRFAGRVAILTGVGSEKGIG